MKYFFIVLMLLSQTSFAQFLIIHEIKTVASDEIIINNYSSISMGSNQNKFQIENPSTYSILLEDANENAFHIIYQCDFEGKIIYLGVDPALFKQFTCDDAPFYKLNHCIKEAQNQAFTHSSTQSIINCVIERINDCNSKK